MGLNRGRIWVGGLVGGVVWVVWGFVTTFVVIGMGRYQAAQNAGFFLKEPRYAGFQIQWIVVEFILAMILAHLYAWVRSSLGPGPKTAVKIGALVGFAIGFPSNFSIAAWAPFDRIFPLGWMLEEWVGAILVTLVAGYFYKD